MINHSLPTDWRDLQAQVNRILQECGLTSEIEKNITTVRGRVNIDVYAEDSLQTPSLIYLCECKYWQSAVPQTVVHAFRTVAADYGANWGLLISLSGFQSGALEAAANSNIRLLGWDEFQELFTDRWLKNYMMPLLYKEIDPLIEYTEPINNRISREADKLDASGRARFEKLRDKYMLLAFSAVPFFASLLGPRVPEPPNQFMRPDLPLRKSLQAEQTFNLPDELLDVMCLRDFANTFCKYAREGIAAFDNLFGRRV